VAKPSGFEGEDALTGRGGVMSRVADGLPSGSGSHASPRISANCERDTAPPGGGERGALLIEFTKPRLP
jgi:hypothetical protein